ncbi:ATP-binding protein [Actinomadura sp. WMMA1423]|uniref:ATP-binding protein n=1 Tax=Actinomadura sp. WMMA1423 TaxID=2591108 RepID=UPI0011470239|nr:ATP-binding protein [Actinomadura sp. WMMA1423]
MHPFTKDVAGICDEGVSTLVLEPDERAPARARRFVAERFAAWGVADDHTGRTIVSELVTNALLHGEGPIVLRLYQDERDGLPTIEVRDGGAGQPVVRPEDHAAIHGRGLLMVAGLALDWGTRPLVEGGKLAWAKCGL